MKQLIKPRVLKEGDTVALISLSCGAAAAFPERYRQGKRQLAESFGLKLVETPHALLSNETLYQHPEFRLSDLMAAFENPAVQGIICNIGGDDTNRLIPLMNEAHYRAIRNNPKVFMGFSDTTVNHFMCYHAGVSSFYGGCTLFTFAENGGIPDYTVQAMKKALFSTKPIGVLPESPDFIVDTANWHDTNFPVRPRRKGTGWRYVQGTQKGRGRLIGGCFDSIVVSLNGTPLMPAPSDFENTVLFLENSEEMPSVVAVREWLRLLGVCGILNRLSGILFARPGNDLFKTTAEADAWVARYPDYDQAFLDACREFGCTHLPIVTNVDFGHTMPQLVLPYGAMCEIDPAAHTVSILENTVVD